MFQVGLSDIRTVYTPFKNGSGTKIRAGCGVYLAHGRSRTIGKIGAPEIGNLIDKLMQVCRLTRSEGNILVVVRGLEGL